MSFETVSPEPSEMHFGPIDLDSIRLQMSRPYSILFAVFGTESDIVIKIIFFFKNKSFIIIGE